MKVRLAKGAVNLEWLLRGKNRKLPTFLPGFRLAPLTDLPNEPINS